MTTNIFSPQSGGGRPLIGEIVRNAGVGGGVRLIGMVVLQEVVVSAQINVIVCLNQRVFRSCRERGLAVSERQGVVDLAHINARVAIAFVEVQDTLMLGSIQNDVAESVLVIITVVGVVQGHVEVLAEAVNVVIEE